MKLFQAFLILFLVVLIAFTAKVISAEGINLLPVFFEDMAKMGWPGQFNLDFLGFLALSATWTAWRNRFTFQGLGLAVLAFFLGMGFLTVYLLILTIKNSGNMETVLLGHRPST